ncbi:MAG: Clp protease/crotonase-like domain-containing protein, partial [Thermoplasmataceae archaeon]
SMIRSSGKPFFISTKGKCLGMGFELALSGDFIAAQANSKIGIPDFMYGIPSLLMPPVIMGHFLRNPKIFRKILSSQIISGKELYDEGIIDYLTVEDADSLSWVKDTLRKLNLQIFSIQKQQNFSDSAIIREYRSFIKSYDTSVVRIKDLEAYRSII